MTPALVVALDALREAEADAPEELLRLLTHGATGRVSNAWAFTCWSCSAEVVVELAKDAFDGARHLPHTPACRLAHWLRVFGGPEEVQRQANAAHEAALREATYWLQTRSGLELRERRR